MSEALIGKKIVGIRDMTRPELSNECWSRPCIVIELDDGTMLYPSSDEEGNRPGAVFGIDPSGKRFMM